MTTRYIGDVTNDNPSSVNVDDAQYILNWIAAGGSMDNLGPVTYSVNSEIYTMVDKIDLGNVSDSDPPSVTVVDAQYILNWIAAGGSMTNLGPLTYSVNTESYTIRELVPPRTINFTGVTPPSGYTGATYADFNDTPGAEGNTILEAGSTNKYSFSEGLANNIPMTVSLANANTNIPSDINLKIKEVNGGTETVLSETRTNKISGVVGPVINFTYDNTKEYVIEVTSTSGQQGIYQLDVNWTRPAITTNGTFEVDIYTLDSTNVWTDGMMDELNQGLNKWDQIITGTPGGDPIRKIKVNTSIQTFANHNPATDGELFGYTDILETSTTNFASNPYYNQYTTEASIRFNAEKYNSDWINQDTNNSHELKDITIHEIGHVLGIGTFWKNNTLYKEAALFARNFVDGSFEFQNGTAGQTDDPTYRLYKGEKALNVYKYARPGSTEMIINGEKTNYIFDSNNSGGYDPSNLDGIPLENSKSFAGASEDDFNPAAGLHPEEGLHDTVSVGSIMLAFKSYKGLGDEIMTGYFEPNHITHPLSAISVGFVEDLGYTVNYGTSTESYCDPYEITSNSSNLSIFKTNITVEN